MNRFESSMTWRDRPKASLTDTQKQWLVKPGALTRALREIGPLTLRVLDEFADGADRDEAHRLGLNVWSPVWIREIVMSINEVECVVARSVTPLSASHGVWQGIRRLRSRPLADILYNNVTITRSGFQVACLRKQTALYRTAYPIARVTETSTGNPLSILARRSVFKKDGTPLLVAECFLPAFWRLV